MAKKVKQSTAPVVAPVVTPAPTPEVAKPLTKRNRVPTDVVLASTDKAPKDRADHTKTAWDVVSKALPATAAELIKALEAAKLDDATQKKLVSFPAYISYMIRRKALAPKAD